jgi:two-component system, chemotaxis family, CheB/CheR fusion protein
MSSTDNEPPATDEVSAAGSEPFFIVGIGASAGGLEALSSLLRRVTLDGAAFVVVQHLAPMQKSMLTELLGRASNLEVVTAADGMIVEPNRVYVAPPNAELALENATLRVATPSPEAGRPTLPIDAFFRSLARDRGPRAIGVVLSGTGTDGTFGLAAIKAEGGITFVQDPGTAKFEGMPRSAIASGVADFTLSPEAIADEILQVSEHPYLRRLVLVHSADDQLERLSAMVKRSSGIDLSHYKPSTIERRLHRRMAVHRLERVGDYVRLCQNDPNELTALQRDLLINVTAFFRDGAPFEVLRSQILPRIVAGKRDADTIRIWVPGCASGEEAYSIAICLTEILDATQSHVAVRIFATDPDGEAIAQARRGVYPANIAADVSPERLKRFFVKLDDGSFQVVGRVRDLIVFSTQNLSRDAPFSRLDLVTCRNVLIYLQPPIQRKVLRIMHYALVPDGILMLGTSETVGESADLFSLVDRKNKIYAAKHVALPQTLVDIGVGITPAGRASDAASYTPARPLVSIAHLADRKVLEQYAPAGVVINENLDVIYFRGRTATFLEQPTGVATHNVLRMVRPELHAPLKHAIDATLASGDLTSVETQYKSGELFRPVTLAVQILVEPETKARCLLILFHETPAAAPPLVAVAATGEVNVDETTRQLKQELSAMRDYLQSTIEELEHANEDLKSANEELQSANEELQSTNEEHETSKEELQSTNEELITLNEELQRRMRDLTTTNDDLHNVLLGVDRAIVIVGMDLRIRRFTQAAEKALGLGSADIGRSVGRLNAFLGGVDIEARVSQSIAEVATLEREMQATNGRWYLLRVAPYKTLDLSIRGAVLSFIDIEVRKRRGELTRAVDEYAAEFLAAVQHALVIVTRELAVIWANDAYYATFSLLPEEVIGARLRLLDRAGGAALEARLTKTLSSGTPFHGLEINAELDGGRGRVTVGGSRIRGVANETLLLLLSVEREPVIDREGG